jgi:hypothetical protein
VAVAQPHCSMCNPSDLRVVGDCRFETCRGHAFLCRFGVSWRKLMAAILILPSRTSRALAKVWTPLYGCYFPNSTSTTNLLALRDFSGDLKARYDLQYIMSYITKCVSCLTEIPWKELSISNTVMWFDSWLFERWAPF